MDPNAQQWKGGHGEKFLEISDEEFYQPGASGIWGKCNGQLLECKSEHDIKYECQ